jgi:hypothetical protein
MTLKELKAGLLARLQTKYPADQYHYYSMAVVEGYERPCFFTQVKPTLSDPENRSSRKNQVTLYINFLQKEVNEAEMLDMIEGIRDLFGLYVQINDRAVDVTGFDWDFVGTDRNIPELSVDLEWMDNIGHEDTEPTIESVQTTTEMEGI